MVVQLGRAPSKRGVGLHFGPDVTRAFCEQNGLGMCRAKKQSSTVRSPNTFVMSAQIMLCAATK